MTKEEILAMEVRLNLDTLIADTFGDSYISEEHGKLYRHFKVARSFAGVLENVGGWVEPLPVSTDISAAWQVVEKMENDGWLWEARKEVQYERDGWLWEARRYPHKSIYEFEFYRLKEGTHHCSGIKDSIPEAICKATLLVKLENE